VTPRNFGARQVVAICDHLARRVVAGFVKQIGRTIVTFALLSFESPWMVLRRHFKATVKARAQRDPAFREALLREAIETMLGGNIETGKIVLRDYINATIGFEALGEATGTSPKSLMRMFAPVGNPQAQNLFAVLGHLQEQANLRIRVHAVRKRVRQRPRVA
jgi:DNA-binding phage protein